jgi:transposase
VAFSVTGVVVPMALHKRLTLLNVKEGISNGQMMAWNMPFVRKFRSSRTVIGRTFNYFDKTCNYKFD